MNKLSMMIFLGCAALCAQGEIATQPFFEWTPNDAPTGWITHWGNAEHPEWGAGTEGKPHLLLTADENAAVVVGEGEDAVTTYPVAFLTNYVTHIEGSNKNQKYQPWNDEVGALSSYTFCVYGNTEFVRATTDKYSILWDMGRSAKTVLAKDSSGNIKLLQFSGEWSTAPSQEINAGPVSDGFHLYTVRFDTTRGASLQIDDGEVLSNPEMRQLSAGGFQIGSILGEPNSCNEASNGFIVRKVIAFDTDQIPATDYAELCDTYPHIEEEYYDFNDRIVVKRGTLDVPGNVIASAPALEFGDLNVTDPVFGDNFKLSLRGQLTILGKQTFDGNKDIDAYNACNNGAGIMFSEWRGIGTYDIIGENALLFAPNSILLACHSATKSTITVDGGSLDVKGITAKTSDTVEIVLTGGGSVTYGLYPCAPDGITITKKYGEGTVITTPYLYGEESLSLTDREANTRTDTDAIELTDPDVGTTFSADYAVAIYSGAITGEGRLNIDCFVPGEGEEGIVGEVVLQNYHAGPITVVSGILTMPADATFGDELYVAADGTLNLIMNELNPVASGDVILRGVTAEDGAKFTVNGETNFNGIELVVQDGNLVFADTRVFATEPVLRISEIMPKPADLPASQLGSLEGFDVNGLESGWVELENTSDKWVDLSDYRFIRVNRGKKTDVSGLGNFPARVVPPHGRTVFYTSERYSNSKDAAASAFATGTFDGAPQIFPSLNNVLVWGDKVNPKKSPYVRLYYAPQGMKNPQVIDTVVIPTDLPEGMSVIVGEAGEEEGTRRWICATPTRGTENTPTAGLVRIGPVVGPLYEISSQKKTDVANEFALNAPPAVPGTDYAITLPVNAVMNPNGAVLSPRAPDAITRIQLVYRKNLDNATLTTNEVDLATKTTDAKAWGDRYSTAIPHAFFPAAGRLIQWKVLITDGEGTVWTAPSFNNKDDGYEWYGTIVEPGELNSASLPTWHMFADAASLAQMDKDVDDQTLVNNARVAIYDASTSNYYDYVRIDLRGNTSAKFAKKSHGLRFSKIHPMTMRDVVTGETLKEFRKTSLISEFADPSLMRQMVAFWLFRQTGNLVPYDFPVRCNLNGAFYQLAFNSQRFTDELIEDYYGLEKYGYGYKNAGTLKSNSSTTAGSIEKKTPDDGNEHDLSVLQNELRKHLSDLGAAWVNGTSAEALSSETTYMNNLNNSKLTKFVVQKFNLPAWLNYMASAKITGENDDVWANLCVYYDNAQMVEGVRGTDTWMPLGYDFNLSFGQWYVNDVDSAYRSEYMAVQDWMKAHPFYGGNRVRCWKQPAMTSVCNNGNDGFEAVWQNAKFRRLYLRRLRTLMDEQLKEPGVEEAQVPFMAEMRRLANLMRADAALDRAKWGNDSSDDPIDLWNATATRPASMDAAIDEIWSRYVEPRRKHLYVTHSVTNTAKAVGYGSNLNAGIPGKQSAVRDLRNGFSAWYDGARGVVVIENANEETVDLSGWELQGPVTMTLPAGTVIDEAIGGEPGRVYVTADRRATVAEFGDAITDQVIVGNGKADDEEAAIALVAANGEKVIFGVIEIAPGEESELDAMSAEEAEDALSMCEIVLSPEDVEAGMTEEMLKIVAKPVKGDGDEVVGYRAVIVVNEETVAAPLFARKDVEEVEPFVVNNLESGETACTLTVRNAVRGLWYGCEVTDDLSMPFVPDVDSFIRATAPVMTIEASPQPGSRAFFRIKVQPVK